MPIVTGVVGAMQVSTLRVFNAITLSVIGGPEGGEHVKLIWRKSNVLLGLPDQQL